MILGSSLYSSGSSASNPRLFKELAQAGGLEVGFFIFICKFHHFNAEFIIFNNENSSFSIQNGSAGMDGGAVVHVCSHPRPTDHSRALMSFHVFHAASWLYMYAGDSIWSSTMPSLRGRRPHSPRTAARCAAHRPSLQPRLGPFSSQCALRCRLCSTLARRLLRCGGPRGRSEVSFQWKNPDFLSRDPDFPLKSLDFIIKQPSWACGVRLWPRATSAGSERPASS